VDLQRVQQTTPLTLNEQWSQDGAAIDPGTVTVGITRADGSVVVAPGAATTGSGTGVRSFNLTSAHTGLLDSLTVTWTTTDAGTRPTTVEVVGGFLFTTAEARTVSPLNDTNAFSNADIASTRTLVEQALEDALGYALVPRYALEDVYFNGSGSILPKWPKIRTVRSLSIAGSAVSAADVLMMPGGVYYPYGLSTVGFATGAALGYEHGADGNDLEAKRCGLILAKMWLRRPPEPDR
jgi:hypothetical protein